MNALEGLRDAMAGEGGDEDTQSDKITDLMKLKM